MSHRVRPGKNKSRLGSFCAPMQWEQLESRLLLSGTAPASLAGDTLVYFKTAGSGTHAPPRGTALEFTSASDVTLQEVNGGAPVAATYTYVSSNGGSTATIVRQSADGTHTLNLAFSTDNIGTIQQIDPDGTSSDIFMLDLPTGEFPSPPSMAGQDLTFTISFSGGTYPTTGSWRTLVGADGKSYTDTALTTNLGSSTGTRTYTPDVNGTKGLARLSYSDSTGTSGTLYLAFAANGGGVFYSFQTANPSNFLSGTFTPTSVFSTTTTTLASTLILAVLGKEVDFTATVAPHFHGADLAAGSVIFKDGTTVLQSVTLGSDGTATFKTSTLTLGRHSITAIYGGDNNFAASASAALDQRVVLSATGISAYITQLYQDLLNRTPDPIWQAQWVHRLATGDTTLAEFATALTSSAEYDGKLVDGFYEQYLGRHAEDAGLAFWVAQMQGGLNAEVIRAGILSSDEYYNRTGGTDNGYVTALYQNFLGRDPDANGLATWTSMLVHTSSAAATNSRILVTGLIATSGESLSDIVTGFYVTYLQRKTQPQGNEVGIDPAGLTTWINRLAEGATQPEIISFFVTSQEYLNLHSIS